MNISTLALVEIMECQLFLIVGNIHEACRMTSNVNNYSEPLAVGAWRDRSVRLWCLRQRVISQSWDAMLTHGNNYIYA